MDEQRMNDGSGEFRSPDMNRRDPSRDRDELALKVAEATSLAMVAHVEMLAADVHRLSSALSVNTAFTREVADKQALISKVQTTMFERQAEMVDTLTGMQEEFKKVDFEKLAGVSGVVQSMRGALGVASWLGNFAAWLTKIAITVGLAYSFYTWIKK